MWQALREKYVSHNVELLTVGLDALGAEACRPFIEAARPTHPSLIDQHHVLANLYGVVNIPQSIWIDENFMIVRPVESAPPPPGGTAPAPPQLPPALPERVQDILAEASKIRTDAESYHEALDEWVHKGAESRFALSPEEVIERSTPRDFDKALGHAHFELACALEQADLHDLAVKHFCKAHERVPDSWTFRRQAWSLEQVDGPFARFWQGPKPDAPESWPYEGDWLSDIQAEGAENYYAPWRP